MDTQSIISELEAERDRFNSAIAALQRGKAASGRSDGRKRHLSAGSTEEDWPGHEETLGGEKKESSGMIQKGSTSCELLYSA